MAERLHPGVYVEEKPSGAGPIQPVATSTAAFVGTALRGRPGYPYFLTSFDDYVRAMGGHQAGENGFLAQAVQGFFQAGGQRAYAVRVLPRDAVAGASAAVATRVPATLLPPGDTPQAVQFFANGKGAWSNSIRVDITDSTHFPGQAFSVAVSQVDATGVTPLEAFTDVTMDPAAESYFPDAVSRTSAYLTVQDLLLGDAGSPQPTKLPVPESAPAITLGGPDPGTSGGLPHYTVVQNTSLSFRWWTGALSVAPFAFTVAFVPSALPGGVTFQNGAAKVTPKQLGKIFKNAITAAGAPFRVSPDPDDGSTTDAMVPSVVPLVATRPYLFLTLPQGATAFDLTGVTALAITLTTSGAGGGVQSFPVTLPAGQTSFTPANLATLIAAAGVPSARVIARGATVMIAGAHGAADTTLGVSGTGLTTATSGAPGPANAQMTTLGLPGHGGAVVDALDDVQAAVSEQSVPGVPAFLRTYGVPARVRGYGEGSAANPLLMPALSAGLPLTGGSDGSTATPLAASDYLGDATDGTGLRALDHVDVNLVALPGQIDAEFLAAGMGYCDERGDCFFIADGPGSVDSRYKIDAPGAKHFVDGLPARSENAAMYFPWLSVTDPVGVGKNPTRYIPPSGHVAGVYARTDISRGVWKAPAGVDALVTGALDVQVPVRDGDQDLLNPSSLNCVRRLAGAGIVSWGARTLAADPQWRYVPVRRMALFLKASLKQGLQWAVFEPNDQPLWDQMRQSITSFMLTLFRQGAFQGSRPDEAFQVRCDASTNPQDLIDQGVVTAQVAFAPLKPAEFVVIQVSQKSLVS